MAALEAKEVLQVAKTVLKDMFKEDWKIPAEEKIDFLVNGDKVTLTHILNKKKAEKARAPTRTFGAKENTGTSAAAPATKGRVFGLKK